MHTEKATPGQRNVQGEFQEMPAEEERIGQRCGREVAVGTSSRSVHHHGRVPPRALIDQRPIGSEDRLVELAVVHCLGEEAKGQVGAIIWLPGTIASKRRFRCRQYGRAVADDLQRKTHGSKPGFLKLARGNAKKGFRSHTQRFSS